MVPLNVPELAPLLIGLSPATAPVYTTAVCVLSYFKDANQLEEISLIFLNRFTKKANCECG